MGPETRQVVTPNGVRKTVGSCLMNRIGKGEDVIQTTYENLVAIKVESVDKRNTPQSR